MLSESQGEDPPEKLAYVRHQVSCISVDGLSKAAIPAEAVYQSRNIIYIFLVINNAGIFMYLLAPHISALARMPI